MAWFRRALNQLIGCFSPCFGRRRKAQVAVLEFQAEETLEKALDCGACELSCSSLQLDVCLDEVVSFHCSLSQESVPSHSSPSVEEDLTPDSSSLSPVSLSSSSRVTVFPDLQIVDVEDEELEDEEDMEISGKSTELQIMDVEDEEDMDNIAGKSTDLQVVPPPDLEITDMEEMDCEAEMEKMEKSIQTPNTLPFTWPGLLEPKRVAWVDDSVEEEEEEEEEVWETEVREIKACEEEEERGDSDSSEKKEEHQPQSRRKVALVMFTWAERRAKERVDKKMKKEREKRERLMLLHRYVNDPKLQHLKINRNNPNYGS